MTMTKRKDQEERRQPAGMACRILLTYEKERSERLNRFFSFCGITFSDNEGLDLVDFLKKELRGSDYVFAIPSSDESGQTTLKLGLLLPETDLEGAELVRDRINQLCSDRKLNYQISLVTYPDDATQPGEILKKAFKEFSLKRADESNTEVES
jgi:hypothetical protein